MSISAPICSSAFRCRSTGRAPIAQPPGRETRAWPVRATSGPSVRIEARMVFTSSYGASAPLTCSAWMIIAVGGIAGVSTMAPMCASSLPMVMMSRTRGILSSSTRSLVRSAAAIAGSAAFFAPLMRTEPSSGLPPSISSLSMWVVPCGLRCFGVVKCVVDMSVGLAQEAFGLSRARSCL